jgi:hypothetical protein
LFALFVLFSVQPAAAAPITLALTPDHVAAGSPGFNLGVSGTGFVSGSSILWNGVPQATTFESDSYVTASIAASLIAFPGSASVAVQNQAVGGTEVSNSLVFTVAAPPPPVPVILDVAPSIVIAGSGEIDLQLYGYNFLPDSVVEWNESSLFTVFLSSRLLRATVPASDLAMPGIVELTVDTVGVVSSPYSFTVASTEPPSDAVPGPASLFLLGTGLVGAATARRKRR